MQASVIIVGDEILAGHVHDSNTHFIAGRLAEHGHGLRRAVVVADDPEAIAGEIRRELENLIGIVFVCGGLGPTHDDRTMEGVAAALGADLVPCEPLATRLEEFIARARASGFPVGVFGVEGIRKMALAPRGAEALPCSLGAIPAVTIEVARARVVVLPGPPRELQAVFHESVESRFLAGTGEPVRRIEIAHPFPESALAAALREIQDAHPSVVIGSYPQRGEVLVRVSGIDEGADAAADAVRARIDALRASEDGKRLLSLLAQRRARRT